MTSNRPYLLRAFFDWIVDNECTPHLVVNADFPAVQVPTQFCPRRPNCIEHKPFSGYAVFVR